MVASVLCLVTSNAYSQTLQLQITDGLVTLDARNVTIAQILARWADVSGVTIVNAEKIEGTLTTLRLVDVPERAALATVLRGVSGYIAASRADGTARPSSIDRILILPSSRPAAAAPREIAGPASVDNSSVALVTAEPPPTEVTSPAAPSVARQTPRVSSGSVFFPAPVGAARDESTDLAPAGAGDAPASSTSLPVQSGSNTPTTGGPRNPFGVTGSNRPGTLAPVPPPPVYQPRPTALAPVVPVDPPPNEAGN
jgi:hypothetical protein